MTRESERSNAHALVSIKNSKGGRVIKAMMNDREAELRVSHYSSQGPLDLAQAAQNKGAYQELMYWYTQIFDTEFKKETTNE